MSIFESLGGLLVSKDHPAHADALVVLDGAEFDLRLATGLGLLLWGHSPKLLVIQSRYHRAQHQPAGDAATAHPNKIFLHPCSAVSTREEAVEICPVLKRWGCRSVTIVTSWCQTRRARTIFERRLKDEGIRVSAYPVSVSNPDMGSWWKSKEGQRTVVIEAAKLFSTWLHLDLPVARYLRFRPRETVQPSSVPRVASWLQASEGPQEEMASNLQSHVKDAQILRGAFGGSDIPDAVRTGREAPADSQPLIPGTPLQSGENGVDIMEERRFKAVNLMTQGEVSEADLAEAFNEWAENEQPSSILHVHYYHDQQNHVRGYRIIFEVSSKAQERPKPAAEEQRAA
jgi:hypothetical protein